MVDRLEKLSGVSISEGNNAGRLPNIKLPNFDKIKEQVDAEIKRQFTKKDGGATHSAYVQPPSNGSVFGFGPASNTNDVT